MALRKKRKADVHAAPRTRRRTKANSDRVDPPPKPPHRPPPANIADKPANDATPADDATAAADDAGPLAPVEPPAAKPPAAVTAAAAACAPAAAAATPQPAFGSDSDSSSDTADASMPEYLEAPSHTATESVQAAARHTRVLTRSRPPSGERQPSGRPKGSIARGRTVRREPVQYAPPSAIAYINMKPPVSSHATMERHRVASAQRMSREAPSMVPVPPPPPRPFLDETMKIFEGVLGKLEATIDGQQKMYDLVLSQLRDFSESSASELDSIDEACFLNNFFHSEDSPTAVESMLVRNVNEASRLLESIDSARLTPQVCEVIQRLRAWTQASLLNGDDDTSFPGARSSEPDVASLLNGDDDTPSPSAHSSEPDVASLLNGDDDTPSPGGARSSELG